MVTERTPVNRALLLVTFLTTASIAMAVVGCSGGSDPPAAKPVADAGLEAGDLCPSAEDKRVHYVDHDPNVCDGVQLECTAEQNGFDNACGCGCIDKGDPLCPPVDDPSITWVSRDPAQCTQKPFCPKDENAFTSSCGCGCARPGG